jgi:hypothetical protein
VGYGQGFAEEDIPSRNRSRSVQVEGERVFCAQAIDGPSDKQKAAVDAAMQWRFKRKRGEFKDDLMGKLRFQF